MFVQSPRRLTWSPHQYVNFYKSLLLLRSYQLQTFSLSTSSSRTRRSRHKVSRSDASSDISVDTPISTYVRWKTPGSSPVSPNFDTTCNFEKQYDAHLAPFSIPTLPILFSHSDSPELHHSPSSFDGEIVKNQDYYRFIRQRRGTRVSVARVARREQLSR